MVIPRREKYHDVLSRKELTVCMIDPPPAKEGEDHGGIGYEKRKGKGDHKEGGRNHKDRAGLNGCKDGKQDQNGDPNKGEFSDGMNDF